MDTSDKEDRKKSSESEKKPSATDASSKKEEPKKRRGPKIERSKITRTVHVIHLKKDVSKNDLEDAIKDCIQGREKRYISMLILITKLFC